MNIHPVLKMKNSNIEISIIVPCYNNEIYVEKCLASIARQTFQNFEVIIVNDGSKDDSKRIIENFIKTDHRFKLINQTNQGVSSARNKGLELAQGKYVCFVDADDYVDSRYLECLIQPLLNCNSDLSICSVIHESIDNKIIYIDELKRQTLSNRETANLKKIVWGYACNKLFKLKIIKENNITFNPKIKFAEDELFYLTYLFKIQKVSFVENALYHYVRQSKSATNDKTNFSVQANRFDSRCIIIDFLKQNNVEQAIIDKHIEACIDTCLLLLAYKFKDTKLSKEQKGLYLKYIKENKTLYLNDKEINWKAKFYLRLACLSLNVYKPIRRLQLKLTHRI